MLCVKTKCVSNFFISSVLLQTASVNQSVAWYACEAVLGKEKYDRLNGRKTGTSVP